MKRERMEQILEIVDLTDWKTYREMRKYGIKMNSGNFQKLVRAYNELFYQRADKTFIAHSNKGYMLTKDTSIIKDSLNDYKRRAFAQLKNYWHGMKSIGAQVTHEANKEAINVYKLKLRILQDQFSKEYVNG